MSNKESEEVTKTEAPAKDTQHGVTRPKTGTKTGRVWEIADAQSSKLKAPAPRKGVLDECVSEGINPATAATQYGRWRKYHGLEGRGTEEGETGKANDGKKASAKSDAGVE